MLPLVNNHKIKNSQLKQDTMSEGLYSMEAKDYDKTLDLTKIKPYGDTMNDGKTQLSFTLPVPAGD